MDNLSPLVKKIMQKAEEEAAAILAEADALAKKTAEAASSEAGLKTKEILAKAEALGKEAVRRANVQASLAVRNACLAEKGKRVSEILDNLPAKLHSLNDKDYATMMRGFVLSVAPLGLVHVLPAPRDKEVFNSAFVSGMNEVLQGRGQDTTLILTGDDADIEGGLLLKGDNVSVDCSLLSICEYYSEELEPIISAALFSDEPKR